MNEKNQALALVAGEQALQPAPFSAFGSIGMFEDAQRMALALCSSSIIPETYRGKEKVGDCVIALEIANRIGASVLAVMQNLYIVYGRPAWSSQFLISCVNASRKFSPLRYRMTGEKGTDTWGCVAWATDKTGEKLESPEVTINMAKVEGWYGKNGSKWKTMPELMLRYRAATLFARLYAPELTMGIQSDDEVIDISPVVTDPVRAAKPIFTETPDVGSLSAVAPSSTGEKSSLESARNPLKAVRGLMKLGRVDEAALMLFLRESGNVDESISSLEELEKVSPTKLLWVYDNWGAIEKGVKAAAVGQAAA